MKKLFIQALIMVAMFFTVFFILNQVNWMTIFRVEQLSKTTEEKLGDMFWDLFNKTEKEIKNPKVTSPTDSIVSKICISNGIEKDKIKIHIIESSEVNAFLLPNNHLVINSGLILYSENEAELCGVICHELAHMEMNHVMKKLIKEVGLSVLISMTAGNSGSEMIKETAKLLSSTAYDRNLEKEADVKAVDYLLKANINPEPFANFLYKLSENESKIVSRLIWISTHPDSKERAKYIIEYYNNRTQNFQSVLNPETWDKYKEYLNEL